MLAQAKLAATVETELDATDFKKDADLSFAGGLGKLAYKDFLDSPEQRKTYIANVVLCNGVCYQDDTAIKTAQIQFNIVPKANRTMAVENLQYRKLDENSLNLYALQQPLKSLLTSNRVLESRIDLPTSFEMLDESHRIFEFSIYGDPIKDELQISKLKLAFSPHGQWFTSLSQDVLVAGTRVQDEAAFEESTAFNKTSFRGVSFNLTQKMQEQIYDFSFESYKYTYMQPKKFKSMFNDTTYQYGLYTNIGSSNAFGYGYAQNSAEEYMMDANPVYRNAGVLVFDPSANFAVGMQQRSSSKDVSMILQ